MKRKEFNTNQIIPIQKTDPDEKETIINFFYKDDEANLYTRDNTVVTKMKHLMEKSDQYKCFATLQEDGLVISYEFIFPKKLLSFRAPNKHQRREFTEEQRKEIGQRLKKSRIY